MDRETAPGAKVSMAHVLALFSLPAVLTFGLASTSAQSLCGRYGHMTTEQVAAALDLSMDAAASWRHHCAAKTPLSAPAAAARPWYVNVKRIWE